jgi:hypothetical protein
MKICITMQFIDLVIKNVTEIAKLLLCILFSGKWIHCFALSKHCAKREAFIFSQILIKILCWHFNFM